MMYSFLDRLISLDLPSTADPEGVKKPYHFDRLGNYKISLRDSSAFPEIRNEHFPRQIGMDICINHGLRIRPKPRDSAHPVPVPASTGTELRLKSGFRPKA